MPPRIKHYNDSLAEHNDGTKKRAPKTQVRGLEATALPEHKDKATAFVDKLFLKQEIKDEIRSIITEIKAWDRGYFSSNQIVRNLRQDIEEGPVLTKRTVHAVIAITALVTQREIPGKLWDYNHAVEEEENMDWIVFSERHSNIPTLDKDKAICSQRLAWHGREASAHSLETCRGERGKWNTHQEEEGRRPYVDPRVGGRTDPEAAGEERRLRIDNTWERGT